MCECWSRDSRKRRQASSSSFGFLCAGVQTHQDTYALAWKKLIQERLNIHYQKYVIFYSFKRKSHNTVEALFGNIYCLIFSYDTKSVCDSPWFNHQHHTVYLQLCILHGSDSDLQWHAHARIHDFLHLSACVLLDFRLRHLLKNGATIPAALHDSAEKQQDEHQGCFDMDLHQHILRVSDYAHDCVHV